MKSKKAQQLMKRRVKVRDNGERYEINQVHITSSDLVNGSVIAFTTYLHEHVVEE